MDKQLTPQGIPTTDFSEKVQEYSKILVTKTSLETEVAKTEFAIRQLFAEFDITVRFRDTTELTGLEEKITIYKPIVEPKKDGFVYACARAEGRAFSEIVSNPPLFKKLAKQFGVEFEKFFREVDDAFHMSGDENQKRQEIDEEKSADIKQRYFDLSKRLAELQINLKSTQAELDNVDKYIDFCKKISSLASGKGKEQPKGGGGNQQQQ